MSARERNKSRQTKLSAGDEHEFFTQPARLRGIARTVRITAWLQLAERSTPAVVAPAAGGSRTSDHRRFHRGADSAGGRDGEVRQKAHAQDLARRRSRRRLSLLRRRQ